jgi:hypothetical protein
MSRCWIPPQDVADFLNRLKLQPRGFNNFLLMLRTFFRFCQVRGWLSRGLTCWRWSKAHGPA